MTEIAYQQNDEIDVAELFFALWAHKIFITLTTILFIFSSGFYAINTDKEYIAKATFEIEQDTSGGLNLSGELGALASIAGFGAVPNTGAEVLLERFKGREFIMEASRNLSLDQDAFSDV